MEQNDISWNLQNFIFWKEKIDYTKIIMSTQNTLVIITSNAKPKYFKLGYLDLVSTKLGMKQDVEMITIHMEKIRDQINRLT
jgi:hypothetical protein